MTPNLSLRVGLRVRSYKCPQYIVLVFLALDLILINLNQLIV